MNTKGRDMGVIKHIKAGMQKEKKEVKVLGCIVTEEKGDAEQQKKEQDFGRLDSIAKIEWRDDNFFEDVYGDEAGEQGAGAEIRVPHGQGARPHCHHSGALSTPGKRDSRSPPCGAHLDPCGAHFLEPTSSPAKDLHERVPPAPGKRDSRSPPRGVYLANRSVEPFPLSQLAPLWSPSPGAHLFPSSSERDSRSPPRGAYLVNRSVEPSPLSHLNPCGAISWEPTSSPAQALHERVERDHDEDRERLT